MDAVSEPAKRVAVLHDVAEDTAHTSSSIANELDMPNDEWAALYFLDRATAPPGTYADYIERLAVRPGRHGDLAREVKVADLRDNLGRWVPELGDDLRKRYERALARLTEGETHG